MSFEDVSPTLARCAQLTRTVAASLERVWENVHDWEHLPHLHSSTISSIRLEEAGPWGWRAAVSTTRRGGLPDLVEVFVDVPKNRYWNRTLRAGHPISEIHVQLEPLAAHETGVAIDFYLPVALGNDLERTGRVLADVYGGLWDEDEAMMIERQVQLDRRLEARQEPLGPVALGRIEELRDRLPLAVTVGAHRYRVVEIDGGLWAYDAVCPHRLGPLSEEGPGSVIARCPWHGYLFDVQTGRSIDGHACKLGRAPRVECDATGVWRLVMNQVPTPSKK